MIASKIDRIIRGSKLIKGMHITKVPYSYLGIKGKVVSSMPQLLKFAAHMYDVHYCGVMFLPEFMLISKWPTLMERVDLDKAKIVPFAEGVKLNAGYVDSYFRSAVLGRYLHTFADVVDYFFHKSVTPANFLALGKKLARSFHLNGALWAQYNQYIVILPENSTGTFDSLMKIVPFIDKAQPAKIDRKLVGPISKDPKKVGIDLLTKEGNAITGNLKASALKHAVITDLGVAISKSAADISVTDLSLTKFGRDIEDIADTDSIGRIAYEIANEVVGAWADSSQSTPSTYIQAAAEKKWKLNVGTNSWWAKKIKKTHEAFKKPSDKNMNREVWGITEDLLEAMYRKTQALFKKHGIKGLHLFRGMEIDKSKWTPKMHNQKFEEKFYLNPLSSFSADPDIARQFGSIIVASYFPVEKIVCCPITGMGCWNEHEFVVMGGLYTFKGINVLAKSNVPSKKLEAPFETLLPMNTFIDAVDAWMSKVAAASKIHYGFHQSYSWAPKPSQIMKPRDYYKLLWMGLKRMVENIQQGKPIDSITVWKQAWDNDPLSSFKSFGKSHFFKVAFKSALNHCGGNGKKIANWISSNSYSPKNPKEVVPKLWGLFSTGKQTATLKTAASKTPIDIDDYPSNSDWLKPHQNIDDDLKNSDWIQTLDKKHKEKEAKSKGGGSKNGGSK
jgi:hypothetical protein